MLFQLLREVSEVELKPQSDAPYCWSCCRGLFWTRTLYDLEVSMLHRLSGRYLQIAPVYLQGCTRLYARRYPSTATVPNDLSLVVRVKAYYSVGSSSSHSGVLLSDLKSTTCWHTRFSKYPASVVRQAICPSSPRHFLTSTHLCNLILPALSYQVSEMAT